MKTEKIALVIVAVALGVPVLRYALAFQAVEPMFHTWFGPLNISPVTGLLFGLSYEAAAFIGMREAMAARRRGNKTSWWWPLASALVQTAVGIAIVLPVLVAELQDVPLDTLLGGFGGWLWSGIVAAATLLTFATVALALAVQPAPRKASKDKAKASKFVCKECNYVAKHQRALNAHMRKHKSQAAAQVAQEAEA